jgi:hypothetical protein
VEKCTNALSLRTRERLELSNTTPLMVTSWGCESDGPGPGGGRTVGDGRELGAEFELGAWYSARTCVFDDGGLYEGLTYVVRVFDCGGREWPSPDR